jgi:hypothetical protein
VILRPIEGAVVSRNLHLVKLVVQSGGRIDLAGRARLVCLAEKREAPDIVRYLQADGERPGSVADQDCRSVALPW